MEVNINKMISNINNSKVIAKDLKIEINKLFDENLINLENSVSLKDCSSKLIDKLISICGHILITVTVYGDCSIQTIALISHIDLRMLEFAIIKQDCSIDTIKKINAINPHVVFLVMAREDITIKTLKKIYQVDKYLLARAISESTSAETIKKIHEVDNGLLMHSMSIGKFSTQTAKYINTIFDFSSL